MSKEEKDPACIDCGGSVSFYFEKAICIFCETSYVHYQLWEEVQRILNGVGDVADLILMFLESSRQEQPVAVLSEYAKSLNDSVISCGVWTLHDPSRILQYMKFELGLLIAPPVHKDLPRGTHRESPASILQRALQYQRYNYRESRSSCTVHIDFLKDLCRTSCLLWKGGFELESEVIFQPHLYGRLYARLRGLSRLKTLLPSMLNPRAPKWHPWTSQPCWRRSSRDDA